MVRKSYVRTRRPVVPFRFEAGAPVTRRADFEIAKPAVFLDRDGTLMEEVGYCANPLEVRSFSRALGSLSRLHDAGFLNIIITNQSGIGRGLFSLADFEAVHTEFILQVGPRNIDATYFCADHPDQPTLRRKPGIGMIEEAVRDWNIDLSRSWMIGDKAIDIECGKSAGLRTILVETGYGAEQVCQPTKRARDIATAVDWIVIE